MSSDDKFWVSMWSLITIVLLSSIFSLSYHSWDYKNRAVDLAKAGKNPMEVACYLDSYDNKPTCIQLNK